MKIEKVLSTKSLESKITKTNPSMPKTVNSDGKFPLR